jgi:uncharacterized protein (TIRG00374 family)
MKRRLFTILQYIFFLALGIFLAWWSIRDLTKEDKSEIKAALSHARYFLIIPVIGILLLSHYLRGLRWRLLIEPLGYPTSKTNTFLSVLVGYLTNLAFPRLGEVMRCTVLARYEKVPIDKLIGTVILERIIDALTLLIVFGITLAIQPGIYSQLLETFFHTGNAAGEKSNTGKIILWLIAGIILIALIAWMIIKKKNFNDLVALFRKILYSVWQGVSTIQHLKKRFQFIVLTIVIWSFYLLGGYIGFFALQETGVYGIKEAFSILSAGSVGMIVTPGGIGAYAVLIEKTMQLYGLQKGVALAFGWLLWVVQTSTILLGGLISFVYLPYFNNTKRNEKS